MALLIYLFVGFVISSIFVLVPDSEIKSLGYFILIALSWFPLFILGIVMITFFERQKIIF